MIGFKKDKHFKQLGHKSHASFYNIGKKSSIQPSNSNVSSLSSPIPIEDNKNMNAFEPVGIKQSYKDKKGFNSLEKK